MLKKRGKKKKKKERKEGRAKGEKRKDKNRRKKKKKWKEFRKNKGKNWKEFGWKVRKKEEKKEKRKVFFLKEEKGKEDEEGFGGLEKGKREKLKLLIFSERASKILTNFDAGAAKIPTIFALASSNVGRLATFWTPAWSKTSLPIIPPKSFRFSLVFANFDKILADMIASSEKATAVAPVNRFERSLHFVFSSANLVILFLVI